MEETALTRREDARAAAEKERGGTGGLEIRQPAIGRATERALRGRDREGREARRPIARDARDVTLGIGEKSGRER